MGNRSAVRINGLRASVVIPAYNAAGVIGACLAALGHQTFDRARFEVIVVDDGSTDGTADVCRTHPGVTVITQSNQGPAKARNTGARAAAGEIVVFTDADCEPIDRWMELLLAPFADPAIGGAKGSYRSRQPQLVAQFVQLEYESRYEITKRHTTIDYIDTYAAAFRRELFLAQGGYNTDFPVACAEDAEFSFRLKEAGVTMVFVPAAVVYHLHPDTVGAYFRKKVKFAYWRLAAGMMHPRFAVKDTHTPQLMKMQVVALYASAILMGAGAASGIVAVTAAGIAALLVFMLAGLPFYRFLVVRDRRMLWAGPLLMAVRSTGQGWGMISRLVDVASGRNRIITLRQCERS